MDVLELEGLVDDLLLLVASSPAHHCPIAWFCLENSGSSLGAAAMTASTSCLGGSLPQCSPWSSPWSSAWSSPGSGSCTQLHCGLWCRSWMKMEVVGFVEEVLEEVGHLLSDKPSFAVWWKQSLGLERLVMTCLSELLGVLGVLVEETVDWCS